MKSWKEFETQAMNELELVSDYDFYPKKVFDVYIYKGGKVVDIVYDVSGTIVAAIRHNCLVASALKKHDTRIYEAVCTNETQVEQAKYFREAIQSRTFDLWHTTLLVNFGELNKNVFDLCYDQAWDRYHHAGYDEVANGMHDIVYFAKQIIEASK